MDRVMQVLLSNSNIGGSASALLVLVAYLLGLIEQYWFGLAALAYALGFLAFKSAPVEACPESLTTEEALNWLKEKALPHLQGEARTRLVSILEVVAELAPRLKELEAQGLVQAENRAKVKQLLKRYLPDTLTAYLRLPSLYAQTTKVGDKTPYVLLVEQLILLDQHVKEIRDGIYSENINELLTNARFLQEKFEAPKALKL